MQILNEHLSNARWKNVIDVIIYLERIWYVASIYSGIPGEKCDLFSSFMKEKLCKELFEAYL